jgi:uncharacterized protein (DUF2342 family)
MFIENNDSTVQAWKIDLLQTMFRVVEGHIYMVVQAAPSEVLPYYAAHNI